MLSRFLRLPIGYLRPPISMSPWVLLALALTDLLSLALLFPLRILVPNTSLCGCASNAECYELKTPNLRGA
jgi:hypothetical protein